MIGATSAREHYVKTTFSIKDAALRQAMAERAAGGPPLEAPYDDLARQIGEAAYKVTDEQVAKVVEKAGSEGAAFELIVASALGAGSIAGGGASRSWRRRSYETR